jgi:hypothetical protein
LSSGQVREQGSAGVLGLRGAPADPADSA